MAKIVNIKIEQIEIDNAQPRENFREIDILAESIVREGLMQPIEIVEIGQEKYRIIDGERRFRAYKLLRKNEIECIIREKSAIKNSFIRQLTTDFTKNKLNFVEQARGIEKLLSLGYDKKQVMSLFGIKNTKYLMLLGILKFNDNTKKEIIAGRITSKAIYSLIQHKLEKEAEDRIVQQIIKTGTTSKEKIDKLVLENQNMGYIISRYLDDSFVFQNKTQIVTERLFKNKGAILEEIKNSINSNDNNTEREVKNLMGILQHLLDLIEERRKLNSNEGQF